MVTWTYLRVKHIKKKKAERRKKGRKKEKPHVFAFRPSIFDLVFDFAHACLSDAAFFLPYKDPNGIKPF